MLHNGKQARTCGFEALPQCNFCAQTLTRLLEARALASSSKPAQHALAEAPPQKRKTGDQMISSEPNVQKTRKMLGGVKNSNTSSGRFVRERESSSSSSWSAGEMTH